MFVPIVRRTVTVTARQTFHFPWGCDGCGLQTVAHVAAEGSSSATSLYVSANQGQAQQGAAASAHANAIKTLGVCPCPRCGTPALMHRQAVAAWEQSVSTHKARRRKVLIGGLAVAFLSSGGCSAMLALSPAATGTASDIAAVAIFGAVLWFMLCAAATGIVYALTGRGRKPFAPTTIPHGVSFDPPGY